MAPYEASWLPPNEYWTTKGWLRSDTSSSLTKEYLALLLAVTTHLCIVR